MYHIVSKGRLHYPDGSTQQSCPSNIVCGFLCIDCAVAAFNKPMIILPYVPDNHVSMANLAMCIHLPLKILKCPNFCLIH